MINIIPSPISIQYIYIQTWDAFSEALEEWKKGAEGGEFWSLISQAWGGESGTGHRALLALIHLAIRSKGKHKSTSTYNQRSIFLAKVDLFHVCTRLQKKVMSPGWLPRPMSG